MSRVSALLGVLLFAAVAAGQDVDARIETLCRSLGSEDAAVREKATKELISIGKPAIAALKKLVDSPDAEVKARAEGALQAIALRLRGEAVKLVVATDKKSYRPGEVVHVEAKLRNTTEEPVVVTRFEWDGGLTANSWIIVSHEGKELKFDGDRLPQVMVHGEVDEDRFLTIPPKGEAVVRSVEFSEYWDLGGKDPGLKESYEHGKTLPLTPGTYKAKAVYGFARGEGEPKDPDFGVGYKFKGKSRELFDKAWTGSLEAEVEFTVADKD